MQDYDSQAEDEDEDEEEEANNQYYDSLADEIEEDWNQPIFYSQNSKSNNNEEQVDEDIIEEEKIYSICTEGKKTQIQTVELYGFFFWNLTALLFLAFLIWCFVPTPILNSWGFTYIPNKYYAIAVPTWIVITMCCIVLAYVGFSQMHVHNQDSYFTMQDFATILTKPKDSDQGVQGPSSSNYHNQEDDLD